MVHIGNCLGGANSFSTQQMVVKEFFTSWAKLRTATSKQCSLWTRKIL